MYRNSNLYKYLKVANIADNFQLLYASKYKTYETVTP